ncbi:hypothetical protein [Caballeronia mineralivorans]|uniref:hypothetical protein n=1 Tax=Caballeronia mineralivorans TaxID=2010198 RepID=UPI0023F40A01|nr:hypothetical protein [Caballeronia mineralivorans]MDB5783768.1 hypothetical protein [Caballeronia mineralivorans]
MPAVLPGVIDRIGLGRNHRHNTAGEQLLTRAFYLVGSGAELEGCVVGGKAGVPPFEVLTKAAVDHSDSHLRLRPHFTLRRHLGAPYLDLLRFFFNHRRFMRSRRAERKDKSPCELMTGQEHPHRLTLLGLGLLQPQRT